MQQRKTTVLSQKDFSPIYKKAWYHLAELTTGHLDPEDVFRVFQGVRRGSAPFLDCYGLYHLTEKVRPKQILEIGSFLGMSTHFMLEASREWSAKLVSIDPNIPLLEIESPRSVFHALNAEFKERITSLDAFFALNTSELSGPPVIDRPWNEDYDLIFIDGFHEVVDVIENFRLAKQMLSKNGVIAFHDIFFLEEVRHTVEWLSMEYSTEFSYEPLRLSPDYLHDPVLLVEHPPQDDSFRGLGLFTRR